MGVEEKEVSQNKMFILSISLVDIDNVLCHNDELYVNLTVKTHVWTRLN